MERYEAAEGYFFCNDSLMVVVLVAKKLVSEMMNSFPTLQITVTVREYFTNNVDALNAAPTLEYPTKDLRVTRRM